MRDLSDRVVMLQAGKVRAQMVAEKQAERWENRQSRAVGQAVRWAVGKEGTPGRQAESRADW